MIESTAPGRTDIDQPEPVQDYGLTDNFEADFLTLNAEFSKDNIHAFVIAQQKNCGVIMDVINIRSRK